MPNNKGKQQAKAAAPVAKWDGKPYDSEGRLWAEVGKQAVEILAVTPPKFEIGSEEAVQYLREHGYVVFKNAASPAEIQQAEDLFWDSSSKWYGVHKNKVEGWTNERWTSLAATRTGVVSNDSSAHTPFMWYVRGLPKIKQAYQTIWNNEEKMLVSFDGFGLYRPPEIYGQTRAGWFHLDQNGYNKPGLHCVQGFLNMYPSGSEDGGLVVVPGSHIKFDEWFGRKQVPPKRSDFVMLANLPMQNSEWWGSTLPIKVNADPGDFVMWDSRTSHCSHPAKVLPEGTYPKRLRRLVAYVCMTPSYKAKDLKDLTAKRQHAFDNGITLNHWPHEYTGHPTDHSDGNKKYEPVVLSDHQRNLLHGQ